MAGGRDNARVTTFDGAHMGVESGARARAAATLLPCCPWTRFLGRPCPLQRVAGRLRTRVPREARRWAGRTRAGSMRRPRPHGSSTACHAPLRIPRRTRRVRARAEARTRVPGCVHRPSGAEGPTRGQASRGAVASVRVATRGPPLQGPSAASSTDSSRQPGSPQQLCRPHLCRLRRSGGGAAHGVMHARVVRHGGPCGGSGGVCSVLGGALRGASSPRTRLVPPPPARGHSGSTAAAAACDNLGLRPTGECVQASEERLRRCRAAAWWSARRRTLALPRACARAHSHSRGGRRTCAGEEPRSKGDGSGALPGGGGGLRCRCSRALFQRGRHTTAASPHVRGLAGARVVSLDSATAAARALIRASPRLARRGSSAQYAAHRAVGPCTAPGSRSTSCPRGRLFPRTAPSGGGGSTPWRGVGTT